MNLFKQHITADEITEMTDAVLIHSSGAKFMLDGGEDYRNMALYHLSAAVKIMLIFLCLKHKVAYANNDSIDWLFGKTYKFLPSEISEMAADICYWHNDLQYKPESIMNADEVMDIGYAIQTFYNDCIVPLITEVRSELHEKESEASTADSLMKF